MRSGGKIVVIVSAVLLLTLGWAAAAGLVDQRGVLTGRVVADQLVSEGAVVSVGTPLVFIGTPVGPVPATRANVNGVVRQVLVKPGDMIHTGDVLVRMEAVQRR